MGQFLEASSTHAVLLEQSNSGRFPFCSCRNSPPAALTASRTHGQTKIIEKIAIIGLQTTLPFQWGNLDPIQSAWAKKNKKSLSAHLELICNYKGANIQEVSPRSLQIRVKILVNLMRYASVSPNDKVICASCMFVRSGLYMFLKIIYWRAPPSVCHP